MLGEHYEGLQSEAQPNCEAGVFPTTLLPTMGGTLQISSTPTEQPSSESTGTTNPNGSTTASGSERGQSSPPPVYKDVPAHARTKITHVKKSGGRITVTFTEVDGSRGLRFMCGIDRHPAIRCTSPATLRLAPGVHRLKIASVGNRGELTSVPAYIRLTVRR
jgi:hypothetical protein